MFASLTRNQTLFFMKVRGTPGKSSRNLRLAYKFNETISVDLKVWKVNLYFLVIVDIATRYCSTVVIQVKKPKTIIKGPFLTWISRFDAPHKLLSDNGGEFNNVDMRQLGEYFNMEIMTTAAQSPWSNGIRERQNALIGDLVNKILLDTSCDTETALAWAISARNALSYSNTREHNLLHCPFSRFEEVKAITPSFSKVLDTSFPRSKLFIQECFFT